MKFKCITIRMLVGVILWGGIVSSAFADEKRKDIANLLDLTGSRNIADQMLTKIIPQIMDLVRKADSSLPDTLMREFEQEAVSEFKRSMPEMMDGMVVIYEGLFSHEEIHDLIEFYQSPVGKKIIQTMPQLLEQSMALGHAWGIEVGNRVAEKIARKARAKGYNL